MKYMKGLTEDSNELLKEANLLCGDAIVNFKTVQSFGHEEEIIKIYEEFLEPVNKLSLSANIKVGIAFGITQLSQFVVFAAMFYAAGIIINNGGFDDKGQPNVSVENVFTAVFAIMFGASHAGTASVMGPDIGKATASADRIFKIIDEPSSINAI
jgi:ABC-type multidrug transport system fused ATPase/permease subunit